MRKPYYAIQPAFTGGEISEDVASRVDLDKYQLALLQAENMIIRPYGTAKKRHGLGYLGTTKNNGKAILRRFEYDSYKSYMLEIGAYYIRIWEDGEYTGTELVTPYPVEILPYLRTVQSVDVMYICSGAYPVYKLSRYSDSWTFTQVDWTLPAFADINKDDNIKLTPGSLDGTVTINSNTDLFTADHVGDYLKLEQKVNGSTASISATTTPTTYTSAQVAMPYAYGYTITKTGTAGGKVTLYARYTYTGEEELGSNDPGYVDRPLYTHTEAADWDHTGTISQTYDEDFTYSGYCYIKVENLSSTPMYVKLTNSDTNEYKFYNIVNVDTYSSTLRCGDSWKIITHGTWTGKIYVQISYDGGETWKDHRTYTSKDDYNPTETGTVDEVVLIRLRAHITSGTCNADLSTFPYRHIGYAKITARTNARKVTAKTIKPLGSLDATSDWSMGAWSESCGYPYAVTFFQDRLCFGGSDESPQRVWMSVTGDYENFEVSKEGGSVTDDSAITVDLLSQNSYSIMHMLATTDLIVMTEGNTWTISGSETVTPSNISPRNQETYGANFVNPIKVGTRVVYVQRRGSTVRDVGYTYDSDSYVGVDLTLLAKHLVRSALITDVAYASDPDSCLHYVTQDGRMLILTYVPEQKVYAWSHFVTDGKFLSVCSVAGQDADTVMTIVERTIGGQTKRYIEYFHWDSYSNDQQTYGMLDSFKHVTPNSAEITGLDHLEGKTVQVLADGYYYDVQEYKVVGGKITLPEAVEEAIVGLPYTMTMEQCNFDVGNTEMGTIQGRKKRAVSAILRLNRSYGGSIGPDADHQNKIIYDPERLELGENVLFSGDKEITLAIGGFNNYGRTYIVQDSPYPFNISAIIRKVELDV